MSWQTYVDSNLVGSGGCTQAAIFGHDGGRWAISSGWNISTEEIKGVLDGYKDGTRLNSAGITIAGKKYYTVKSDQYIIYACAGSNEGICCEKTAKSLLVVKYQSPIMSGTASIVVHKVAEYLRESGY